MANAVISWAKENPMIAGAAAVGIIVVVMLVTGGGSEEDGGSSGMGSAGVQAYYAAVAQQGQAGAAIQIAQIQANAETNKALTAANYGIESVKIWAPVSLAGVQANAANEAATIQAQRELQSKELDYTHAQSNNYINYLNAQLTQQQNIAFKQANVAKSANKLNFFSNIFKTAVGAGTAVATGGTSMLMTSGAGTVKLPALGSSGQWV